jgi:predicted nucleic acid-binding protein
VKYLLDVNPLVALGFIHHEFHDRVAAGIKAQRFPELATCSITELGFVRVVPQAPAYGFTAVQARTALLRLKRAKILTFAFITDAHDLSHPPAGVKSPRQTTDGHRVELARVSGAILATLDEKVPGSYRIL